MRSTVGYLAKGSDDGEPNPPESRNLQVEIRRPWNIPVAASQLASYYSNRQGSASAD